MKVQATKLFISTVYGNVPRGRILECSDVHGAHFIKHGLAQPVEPAQDPNFQAKTAKPDPIPPTATEAPGLSSPAGQALPAKTATASESGVKKEKPARPVRKSVKSRR
jgi:hypothetical protein